MKKIMFNDKYGLTQAVLDGRKTQTRCIITCSNTFRGQYVAGFHVYKRKLDGFVSEICMYDEDERDFEGGQIVPKYKVGEIVAIAQSYKDSHIDFIQCDFRPKHHHIWGHTCNMKGWNNKMFVQADVMPHQIQITNVRVERLQDISDEDCLAEGILKEKTAYGEDSYNIKIKDKTWYYGFDTPKEAYALLIDKVGKKGDWDSNPYVFVYEFELIK